MTPKQIEELQKLKQLLDSGVINQQEFESEKQKLLNETNNRVSNNKLLIISCGLAIAVLALIIILLCGGNKDNNNPQESDNSEISQEVENSNGNEDNSNNSEGESQATTNHHYVLTNILKENSELIGGGILMKDRTSYEFILPGNTCRWFVEFSFAPVIHSYFGMYKTLNENLDTKEGLPIDILSMIPQPQGQVKCYVMILDEENNKRFINQQPFESLYDISFESQGLFELTSVLRPGKYYLAMRNSATKRYYFNSEILAIVDKNN